MNAIELVDLKKVIRVGFLGRKKELLSGVTLAVPEGAIFGFVGHNGAGKSTTIKHLFGAARPTSGTVRVLEQDPRGHRVRRSVGYLPEVPQLARTLTPLELLRLHSTLIGLRDWRPAADALLERVSLSASANQRIGEFSKGMQQRAALALALLGEPRLLILDEPMSGLDPVGRALVREIIRDQHDKGVTVFFSSHILSDVEALCSHLAVVHRGKTVRSGNLADVAGAPSRHEVHVRFDEGRPPATDALGAWETRGPLEVLVVDEDAVGAARAAQEAGGVVERVEAMRPRLETQLLKWFEQ